MSGSNHNASGTDNTDGGNPNATLPEKPTWSFSGILPAENTPTSARGSSLPSPTRGDTEKQQDAPRSSAPPDFEMEIDGQERENQQDFQTRSQPPSGDQSEESLENELRNEVERAEANGHPASQSSQHSNPRSGATRVDQRKGIRDNQKDATTGHRTPPSGQESTAAEEAPIDPKELLDPYEWDDLEERFLKKMEECQEREEEIEKEFREWIQVFQAWASTTREHEEQRAHKRLRTRMAWVQNSEHSLEGKRQHYIKVVQAFESALALLTGP